MGSISGTCEIVEVKDEPHSIQCSRGTYGVKSGLSVGEKDHKPPVYKMQSKDSVEEDIDRLFEAITRRNSLKGLAFSPQEGRSPSRKSALKRPTTMGVPHSPRVGHCEPVSLKQALRELSISKASEIAATRRLSKSSVPSRNSEAERIQSLYETVVVENHVGISTDEERVHIHEISPVAEESGADSQKPSHHLQVSKKTSNGTVPSSPLCTIAQRNGKETALFPNGVSVPMHLEVPKITTSNLSSSSSPRNVATATNSFKQSVSKQKETVSTSKKVVAQTLKMELAQEERYSPPPTPSCSSTAGKKLELNKKVSASTKIANNASAPKSGRKSRLQTPLSSPNSVSGKGVNKSTRNIPRSTKLVPRDKTSVKKKNMDSTSVACNNKVNSDSDPSTSELVCHKCRCNMKETSKEPDQHTSASHYPDISSNKVKSGASKAGFTSSSCKNGSTVTPKVKSSKSTQKGEFSQSSKSSAGEYSTSTSNSEESNLSGSSCGNRPHMSKDVRWEAVRRVRMKQGVLDLNHFNLLKKLGCGDIGTVYLAELIGTNCLFAIKVMDNEFLAKRKKMPRAQTEREILGMLDHPFLPTLFAQFTTDNLSCLVMEYCPGGDLHVLRQKQPGRNYSEQAARFYVAEVLLALEYLHMLGVVYRDLKPENILVREDGHIMLTDFDLSLRCTVNPTLVRSSSFNTEPAKTSGPCVETNCIDPFCIEPSCQVPCFTPRILPAAAKARKIKTHLASHIRSLPQLVAEPTDARSNSFVGTHEYLAPEIIKGEGHGAAVDWWTFGIFLYELLYGKTPFKGSGNDETLGNVVLQNLRFPDSPLVSFHARDLIRGLLVKEPEHRLGSEKGAAEIKQHPFFEGLNWALIRCTIPPEIPEIHDFVPSTNTVSHDSETKYLECKASGEHLEFEF